MFINIFCIVFVQSEDHALIAILPLAVLDAVICWWISFIHNKLSFISKLLNHSFYLNLKINILVRLNVDVKVLDRC